uniref:Dynein_attach_N domain-containing protein n=1 Tax=Macrostomum lignano TaxID=282301 RepID=A0A1I8FDF1_9PLAT
MALKEPREQLEAARLRVRQRFERHSEILSGDAACAQLAERVALPTTKTTPADADARTFDEHLPRQRPPRSFASCATVWPSARRPATPCRRAAGTLPQSADQLSNERAVATLSPLWWTRRRSDTPQAIAWPPTCSTATISDCGWRPPASVWMWTTLRRRRPKKPKTRATTTPAGGNGAAGDAAGRGSGLL